MIQKLIAQLRGAHIKVTGFSESYSWVRIELGDLDCNDLWQLSGFIVKTFQTEGKFTHLLPKVSSRDNELCLVLSADLLKITADKLGW